MDLIKIRFENLKGPSTFSVGNKYTFHHQTHLGELFSSTYIGTSRIDGHDIFKIQVAGIKYPVSQYAYALNNIADVSLINSLQNHFNNFDQSTFQKNKEILLGYCIDKYNININDLYDDETFKPMMREIILNGLLPRENGTT